MLSNGKFEFLVTEGQKLGYRRYNEKVEITVLINTASAVQTFSLPGCKNCKDLLSGKTFGGPVISLDPFTTVILQAPAGKQKN